MTYVIVQSKILDNQQPKCLEFSRRSTKLWKKLKMLLLFPVVPDVLDIVVIFHGVDELLHPKPSVSWEKREEIKENGDEIICKIKLHVNK